MCVWNATLSDTAQAIYCHRIHFVCIRNSTATQLFDYVMMRSSFRVRADAWSNVGVLLELWCQCRSRQQVFQHSNAKLYCTIARHTIDHLTVLRFIRHLLKIIYLLYWSVANVSKYHDISLVYIDVHPSSNSIFDFLNVLVIFNHGFNQLGKKGKVKWKNEKNHKFITWMSFWRWKTWIRDKNKWSKENVRKQSRWNNGLLPFCEGFGIWREKDRRKMQLLHDNDF